MKLPNLLDEVFEYATTVDSLTKSFNVTLTGLLDQLDPARTKERPQKICRPWINESLISLRKDTRKLERQWRHSKLELHYQMWHESLILFQASMSDAKAAYYSNLISNNKHNPRFLFDAVARLTQCQQPLSSADLSASDFMEYYNEKVDNIRNKIPQSSENISGDVSTSSTSTEHVLSDFELISMSDLTKMVMAARCTTCSVDPLPAWVVKELWSTLGHYVLTIMNSSLSTGIFPACFKSAVVKPLLKKPNLDPNSVANYRPVSNLSFLSKIL